MSEIQDVMFKPEFRWKPPTIFPDLTGAKIIAIDTENKDPNLKTLGPGDIRRDGYVAGISIASNEGFKGYYPIAHFGGGNLDHDQVINYFKDVLKNTRSIKLFANADYDLGWLSTLGIEVGGDIYDVQHREALIDEEREDGYSLESLSKKYIGRGKEEDLLKEAAEAYGIDPKRDLWKLPSHYVRLYAETDAVNLIPIFLKQEKEIIKQNLKLIDNIESRLIPLVHKMRQRGVPIDLDAAERLSASWKVDEDEMRVKFFKEYGYEPDEWSGQKIAKTCDRLDIAYSRTEKGNPSFTTNFLKYSEHPFLQLIYKIRTLNRLRRKYVDDLILRRNINGKIHARFHQLKGDEYGARTGRFSMSDPSLHQVPIRDPVLGPLIRSLFIPEDGMLWEKLDYSQQEPRITVHYACLMGFRKSDRFKEMYIKNPDMDFYAPIIEEAQITRRLGKDMALGRNYGMGIGEMTRRLNCSRERAIELLNKFDEAVPFIKELSDNCKLQAGKKGYIRTILGRRQRFKYWEPVDAYDRQKRGETIIPSRYEKAKRKWSGVRLVRARVKDAFNRLIQGSAADQTKMALLKLYEELGVIPHLQVHDEINSSVEDERTSELHSEIMRDCVELEIPVKVDRYIGKCWK